METKFINRANTQVLNGALEKTINLGFEIIQVIRTSNFSNDNMISMDEADYIIIYKKKKRG